MGVAGKVHPFEAAGLGQAPFAFVGASRQVFQACQGAPIQPGASCDYCGTGIMDVYRVCSADGRRFKVGSDCVRRVWAEFDETIPADFRRDVARMDAEKREVKRQAAHEALMARCARAKAALAERPGLFATAPHPHPYHAGQGKTLRDYYEWMLSHAYGSGRTEACRAVEKAAAEPANA